MIRQGSKGSINAYYKNKLIVSRPINKIKTEEFYYQRRDFLIRDGLEQQWSLKKQISLYLPVLKNIRYNKLKKNPTSDEWDSILYGYLILEKLRVIPEDHRNGILIMGPKTISHVRRNR